MKAVIYSRVSTNEQHVENQLPALKAMIESRGLTLTEVYSEEESAWKIGHQRELARLLKDARESKFDYVFVWALDRVSREGPAKILQLVAMLKRYRVKLVSLQENFTDAPEGPMTELLFSVYAWVAKQESVRRSERTKAGMARARAEGKQIGRAKGRKDKHKRVRRSRLLIKLLKTDF